MNNFVRIIGGCKFNPTVSNIIRTRRKLNRVHLNTMRTERRLGEGEAKGRKGVGGIKRSGGSDAASPARREKRKRNAREKLT